MKKYILIITCFLLSACGSDSFVKNCFQNISVNETIDLNLSQFIDIQVPGTNLITTLPESGRTVLIIRNNQVNFTVFDLQCPEKGCNSPMTYDGLFLNCSCDNKKYGVINGGTPYDNEGNALNDGSCPALRYNARLVNTSTLLITI